MFKRRNNLSIYVIGDLHLSFGVDKPMDIFGNNWENHTDKIRKNWLVKVKEEDTVILPGDFSWATYLDEAYRDFMFLNSLPGRKILLKGNHDYWWETLSKMKNFLKENFFDNIDFIYNTSILVENKIIVGTRGWTTLNPNQEENLKMLKRENERLKLSIEDGIRKFGTDKEVIVFIHYPPFFKDIVSDEINFIKTMNKYANIKRCYYAHLHGESHKDAIEGLLDEIQYKLVSSDYLKFDLLKI